MQDIESSSLIGDYCLFFLGESRLFCESPSLKLEPRAANLFLRASKDSNKKQQQQQKTSIMP